MKLKQRICAFIGTACLCVTLAGCSGYPDLSDLDLSSLNGLVVEIQDGTMYINGTPVDINNEEQILAQIAQVQIANGVEPGTGFGIPKEDLQRMLLEQAGYVTEGQESFEGVEAVDDGMSDLERVLRANGASDEDIQRAMGMAGEDGGLTFPYMSIVKDIWAKNGVTTDGMRRSYNEMVGFFAQHGINADIGSIDTGFGTVGELCETILGGAGNVSDIFAGMDLGGLA